MLVSEALTEIRNKINDRDHVGLDDSELLSYLNEAIQYISTALIANNAPDMAQELQVNNKTFILPVNFNKFCGAYPVKRTGLNVELLCDPPIKVRYFVSCATVGTDDIVPFNHVALCQIVIKLACIYANSQQKLDVSTDKTLCDEIAQLVQRSMWAGE